MSRKYYFSLLFSVLLFLTHTVTAASFDCKKATKEVEKVICNDKALNKIDSRLGQVYDQLRASLSKAEANQLQKEQIAWIKQRDKKCSADDVNCLSEYCEDRIAILTNQLPAEPPKKATKSAATVATASKLNSQSKVLLRGIGPITFGMSVKKAEATAGVKFRHDQATTDCEILTPIGELEGHVNFVAVNDQIMSVNIYSGKITTRSGIGIDSAESQLLAKYADNMELLGTEVVDGDEFRRLAFVPTDAADENYRIIFIIFDNKVHSFSAGQMPFAEKSCSLEVEEDAGNTDETEETSLLDQLQGQWQSTEDSASVIEISENTWTDIYDNQKDKGTTFNIMDGCADQGGKIDENSNYLQVGGEDGFCYSVDKIDDTELVLIYLPRGNTLTYKKVE